MVRQRGGGHPPRLPKKINVEEDVFAVQKPSGMTSHDVVSVIKKISGAEKVGHAGTLDPLAEGVLIILVGKATKRQREFLATEKEYTATIRLGVTSNTDDADGILTERVNQAPPTRSAIERILRGFIGEIEQIPPAFCAVKIDGRKAYELARKGIAPALMPRRIHIREIKMLSYRWPLVRIRVVCSSGTYIRSIARDLGEILGVGGYIQSLVRMRSGTFTLWGAIPLEDFLSQPARPHQ